jgi:hypothetical protein
MGFFDTYFLGARLYYWFYLLITILGLLIVIAYTQRHVIKRKFYEIRFPEKLIIVSIIYPGNMIRDFPILVPTSKSFELEGQKYLFNSKSILKNNFWFVREEGDKLKVMIEDKEYNVVLKKSLKYRWHQWPRIYYREGCPWPIDWSIKPNLKDGKGNELNYTAQDLKAFSDEKTLMQIYKELEGNGLLVFILILVIVSIIISGVVALKLFGVLH